MWYWFFFGSKNLFYNNNYPNFYQKKNRNITQPNSNNKSFKVRLPRTILSLLGESGGLGRASFFFFVATPVTLRFFRVSVPQIITARFLVNFESPCVRCSCCHFSSSTQIPPPKCTCKRHTLLQICSIRTLSLTRFCFHILPLQCHVVYSPKCV